MRKLNAKGMKLLKTFHLLFAMIWLVGVLAMGVINLLHSQSASELHTLIYVRRYIDDILVIPGAIATLIIALIYGFNTNWGFFKHTWLTVKWILSLFVIIIGTFYFSPQLDRSLEISALPQLTAPEQSELTSNLTISLFGTFFQATLLIIVVVVSVYKPWKRKK